MIWWIKVSKKTTNGFRWNVLHGGGNVQTPSWRCSHVAGDLDSYFHWVAPPFPAKIRELWSPLYDATKTVTLYNENGLSLLGLKKNKWCVLLQRQVDKLYSDIKFVVGLQKFHGFRRPNRDFKSSGRGPVQFWRLPYLLDMERMNSQRYSARAWFCKQTSASGPN